MPIPDHMDIYLLAEEAPPTDLSALEVRDLEEFYFFYQVFRGRGWGMRNGVWESSEDAASCEEDLKNGLSCNPPSGLPRPLCMPRSSCRQSFNI